MASIKKKCFTVFSAFCKIVKYSDHNLALKISIWLKEKLLGGGGQGWADDGWADLSQSAVDGWFFFNE